AAARLPPVRAGGPALGGAPLPRPLAARPGALGGIRAVAQPDRRDRAARRADGAGERPPVGALVPALAQAGLVRPADAAGLPPGAGAERGRRGAAARARRARGALPRQPQV